MIIISLFYQISVAKATLLWYIIFNIYERRFLLIDGASNEYSVFLNLVESKCARAIKRSFKKNETIYLISGDSDSDGNVIIFDFLSTNEISSNSIGNYYLYSLCSLNEKYILVGDNNKELKIIDFDNKSIVKNYSAHNNIIYGIEKIKIPEKGEYIITYDDTEIKLWK